MEIDQIVVMNYMGQMVRNWKGTRNWMDVSNLPPGIYLFQFLKNERPIGISKFVKK